MEGVYTATLRINFENDISISDTRTITVYSTMIDLYIRNLDNDSLQVSIYVDDLGSVWKEVEISAAENTKFPDVIGIPLDPGSHFILISYTDPDLGSNTDSATIIIEEGERLKLTLYTIRCKKDCYYYEHYAQKLPDEGRIMHSFLFDPYNVELIANSETHSNTVADAIIDDIDKVQGGFYYSDVGILLGQIIAKDKISNDLYNSSQDLQLPDGNFSYGTYRMNVSTSQELKLLLQGLDLVEKVWRSLTSPGWDMVLSNLKNIACTVDFVGDKVEEAQYDESVSLDVGRIITKSMVELFISSDDNLGKAVVINLGKGLLDFLSEDVIVVRFDGDVIGRADDYSDVIDPTDEDVPEFFVNYIDEDSTQVIVSIPSFSDHVFSIMNMDYAEKYPIANAGGPYYGSINNPIIFDGTGSCDPNGIITSYQWDLNDDGEFDDAVGPNPAVIWNTIYSGKIHLKVIDNDSMIDINATTIDIRDILPPETIKTISQPKYGIDDIWITSNTIFNLTACDDYSGVNKTYYRIWYDDLWNPWVIYENEFIMTGEGKHYIEYYSIDNSYNFEEIKNQTHFVDNTPPMINKIVPDSDEALQDHILLKVNITDECEVDWVKFTIREIYNDTTVIIDSIYESMNPIYDGLNLWILSFNTTKLPDGYYIFIVNTSDKLENKGYKSINFSIRNWAIAELLPSTENNKAGRTMPIKYSIRIAEVVDPDKPFIRNEELTILIYKEGNPEDILQTSIYGEKSTDYRINSEDELYITNFKTSKKPKTYVVEIWRKEILIDSFQFSTYK